MNTIQSYIAPIVVAATQMLSQPVVAQSYQVQYDTANWAELFLQELSMEEGYTRSIPAHQLAIGEFRTRFMELVEFDKDPILTMIDSKNKAGIPDQFIANILFEDSKKQLGRSRAKYGIRWGDWDKGYQNKQK